MFALVVAGLSIVIVRSNLLEAGPALATFGAALALGGLAVLFALGSFVTIWRQGLTGLGRALTGLLFGLMLLAYPGYLGFRALRLPALTDITTDTANPPRFDVLARQRPPERVAYPGPAAAVRQRAAYPDLAPLQEDIAPQLAYRAALGVVLRRKWQLVDAHPPGGVRRDGTIEAVAHTPILGLRDDVVIRVSPQPDGALIDVRSASRFGSHDFGANAARVRSLLDDIDEAAGDLAPEPQPTVENDTKPAPKRPSKRAPRR